MTVKIDSMSHDGRGVAHVNGKAVFVERAITGETVEMKVMNKKKTYLSLKILFYYNYHYSLFLFDSFISYFFSL